MKVNVNLVFLVEYFQAVDNKYVITCIYEFIFVKTSTNRLVNFSINKVTISLIGETFPGHEGT